MKQFNRILSVLLCLVLVAALMVPAISLRAHATLGDGTEEDYGWCDCSTADDTEEDLTEVWYYHTYTVTKAPTLTEAGTLTGYCNRCLKSTEIVLPALNTEDYTYEETDPATCKQEGTAVYTWKNVAYGEFTFQVKLDKTEHSYEDTLVPASCDKEGCTLHTCTICGDSFKDTVVPPLGHQYVDGVCTRCGANELDYTTWCTCGNRDETNEDLPAADSAEDLPPMEAYHKFTVVTEPTLTSTGLLKGVCSLCDGTTYVELPILSEADYLVETVEEPTYEKGGVDRYTWKDMTFGEFSFDVETDKLVNPLGIPEITLKNNEETGKVIISWPAVENATKYEVVRCETKDGEYVHAITTTKLTYTNTKANAGETWYYKVCAINDEQTGEFCSPKYRTTDLPRPVITNVEHLATSGYTKLTWEPVEGAKEYKVYRADSEDGEYSLRLTTTNPHYTNKNAQAGQVYYYKIKAIHENSAANSAYSKVEAVICYLAKPVVTASHVESSGKNVLSWEAVEGAVKYTVYRSEEKEGDYRAMKTVTALTYTNTNAVAGVTYYYKVKAIAENPLANSEYSSVKTVTCDLAQPKVTGSVNAKGQPKLEWQAVEGAVKYKIYRAESADGDYKVMKTTTDATTLTYTNTSITSGTTYYYRVVAVAENTNANSAKSAVVSVTAK